MRVPGDADVEAARGERDRRRAADAGVAAGDDRDGHEPGAAPAASGRNFRLSLNK
jgi:hypothetical protein